MKATLPTTWCLWICVLASCGLAAPIEVASARGRGGVDGGGGGAIHCEAPNSSQLQLVIGRESRLSLSRRSEVYVSPLTNSRRVQFLDLWEAAAGFGPFHLNPREVVYSEEPVESQIERAVSRLAQVHPEFATTVQRYLNHIRGRTMAAPAGSYVLAPSDTGLRFLPIGCEIVGLGAYSDSDDNLVIDMTVMEELKLTDQAALYVHEAVYKALRDSESAFDSRKTRRIVGLMFSSRPFTLAELERGFPTPMPVTR